MHIECTDRVANLSGRIIELFIYEAFKLDLFIQQEGCLFFANGKIANSNKVLTMLTQKICFLLTVSKICFLLTVNKICFLIIERR